MSYRFVFVMDPIAHIDIEGDSTFALMLEAQRRGHQVFFADQADLELVGHHAWVTAQSADVRRTAGDHYTLGERTRLELDAVDAVFMRKDPPIDIQYITSTWILDAIDRTRVVLINDPQALRDCNEKLFTLQWSHLMPETIVARSPARIREFLNATRDIVVKPLDTAGGSGVIHLTADSKNVGAILDLLTVGGKDAIMAQQFLPRVTEGDRRIILIGGQPIGVINRRPSPGDLRSNMHVGGTAEGATLTDRDREICAALGPELLRRNLPFVGIDIIDGYLTEINVTSPTGFQEINRFDGICSEGLLVDWIEARLANRG